jgi:hypothetical protein
MKRNLKEERKNIKELGIYVPETEVFIPAITLVRHKWTGGSFFMGFQEGFLEIAKKKMGAEATNVFLFLLGQIEYDNLLIISQIEIARELGMKKQNVSRAIKTLIKNEVLEIKDPHRKRRQRFKLSDKFVWKGKLNKTLKPAPKKPEKKATKQSNSDEG